MKKTKSFIRIEPTRDITASFKYLSNYKKVGSYNIGLLTDKEAVKQISQEEKTYGYRNSPQGYCIWFLMPKFITAKLKKELAVYIASTMSFSKYPYFVFEVKKGQGKYLCFLIGRREYQDNEYIYYKKAKRDVYINAVSHKICGKHDVDAILLHHKGDVIDSSKRHFSEKILQFYISNSNSFVKSFDEYKKVINDFLKKHNVKVTEGYYLKKNAYINTNNRPFYSNKLPFVMRQWNKNIVKIEKRIDSFATGLMCCGVYTEEVMLKLQKNLNSIIDSESITYKKNGHCLKVYLRQNGDVYQRLKQVNKNILMDTLDILYEACENVFNKAMENALK